MLVYLGMVEGSSEVAPSGGTTKKVFFPMTTPSHQSTLNLTSFAWLGLGPRNEPTLGVQTDIRIFMERSEALIRTYPECTSIDRIFGTCFEML